MATGSNSSTSTTAAKRSTQRKTAATRRSTTAKKAAQTRQANKTKATTKRTTKRAQTKAQTQARVAEREAQTAISRVGDVAERTVLTSVGATLQARDRVSELVGTYSDRTKLERTFRQQRTKLERDLKRFERRGTKERNRLEREVRKARTRVERELKARTNVAPEQVSRDIQRQGTLVASRVTLASVRVENAAQGALLNATKAARTVSERVAALV